jgi:hypothetical protein
MRQETMRLEQLLEDSKSLALTQKGQLEASIA